MSDPERPTPDAESLDSRPEQNLDRLLARLAPSLDPDPYRFVEQEATPSPAAPWTSAFAVIREREGWTRIERASVEPSPGSLGPVAPGASAAAHWARIELTVHSDLAAVGLTAAVASALAAAGIPANVIAACHHDHLFVPWHDRQRALAALEQLSRTARRHRTGS